MDALHLILASNRLSSSPPRTPPLAPTAAAPREREELLLDEARALLAEGAALLVAAPGVCGHAQDSEALAQALELFDAAIAMAPSLKCYAVRLFGSRGVCVGRRGGGAGAGICARVRRGVRDDRIWPHGSPTHTRTPSHDHSGSAAGPCTTWAGSGRRARSSTRAAAWTRTTWSPGSGASWCVFGRDY